jgi:RNA polymerase sigma-70 factor (ECF subfamily)
LRILKGYSVAETAKLMNKKDGTIRVLQFRAVKALAKLLEETQGKEECF